MLKIESARSTLGEIETWKIPNGDEIEECLATAHHSLRQALGYSGPGGRLRKLD